MPALLESILGFVARMGALGGKSRSEAKAAASRENGKLGGRPRINGVPAAKPLTKKARIKKVAAAKEDKRKARGRRSAPRPVRARKSA